jgi:hypothetical protein
LGSRDNDVDNYHFLSHPGVRRTITFTSVARPMM